MTALILALQCLALGAALGFVVLYWVHARWWQSPTGRNVMGVSLAVAAVLGLVVAQGLVPDYPGRRVAQLIVYTATAALFVQRTIQMLRAQRRP
ncbi:putative phage holin [Oerskovia paurometabola]|uniref:putative phage holin n=1 Tax=Oerskovia paurometabola TaxID=162170 RepID=UPI003419E23E